MIRDKAVLTADGKGWAYFLGGQEVTQAAYEAEYPPPAPGIPETSMGKGWPRRSQALAVLPRMVKAAEDAAASMGVPTQFEKTGEPILNSPQHQREYYKIRRKHDNDGVSG